MSDEKLTVTMAPPPAEVAYAKKKAEAKKRSETENLLDGHAGGIKGDTHREEALARVGRDGRIAGAIGFFFFGLAGFWVATHHGRFLHADANGVKTTFEAAYKTLETLPWWFGSTRMLQFRAFTMLSGLFLVAGVLIPRPFGAVWMRFAAILGFVNTRIILALVFYLLFTPTSLLLKLLGKDSLRLARADGTYWLTRSKKRERNHFERLF